MMASTKRKDTPFSDIVYEDELALYFIDHHKEDLLDILRVKNATENVIFYYPLVIDFNSCIGECPKSMNRLAWYPDHILSIGDGAAFRVETELYEQLKKSSADIDKGIDLSQFTVKQVHVRIFNMPVDVFRQYKVIFPGCEEKDTFMTIKATVGQTRSWLTLNTHVTYKCVKCKMESVVESERGYFDNLPPNIYNKCKNGCIGSKLMFVIGQKTDITRQRKYQEIRIDEKSMSGSKIDPKSMWVVLKDDLVESCKVGDDVIITGVLFLRSKSPFRVGHVIESELAFMANHVTVKNDMKMFVNLSESLLLRFKTFWKNHELDPYKGRDIVIRSFCPDIHRMYVTKLALVMCIIGGVSKTQKGSKVRGESHLLLVGDPGTAKSQLISYSAKLMPRSVFATGVGVSNAGLTVSAVKDGNHWVLEAGALVLADGGLCCIDEFSTIKEKDRVAIHEAMEQQTISIAKAGNVTALPTRCTILAATNPKSWEHTSDENMDMDFGLTSPIVSRFDLVLVLKDTHNREWDEALCDFILFESNVEEFTKKKDIAEGRIWDSETLRSYIVYVKGLEPVMTDDAVIIIEKYFSAQRQSFKRNPAQTTIRLYESLYRLSEAHAKLLTQTHVLVHDAVVAVSLIEVSMQSAALFGEPPNPMHTDFPYNSLEEYLNLAQIVLEGLQLHDILKKEESRLEDLRVKQKNIFRFAKPTPPRRPIRKSQIVSDGDFSQEGFFSADENCEKKAKCSCSLEDVSDVAEQPSQPKTTKN